MSLLGKIEPFHHATDTWTDYWDMIEQYFLANDIEDNKKRTAMFLTLIGKETYSLLNSLTAPDKPSSKKVDEVNNILFEHYEPKPIVIAERYQFYTRMQQDEETLAEYIAELRKRSIHCEFKTFLDEALRDKFVCGLRNYGIRKRLLTEKKLDLTTALSIAQSMENARIQSKHKETKEVVQTYALKPNGTKRRCYRCDSEQHLANACRHKETICNQCNIKGHLAKVCRRSKQKTRNLYSLIKEQSINEDITATANSERNRYKSDEDDDEEVYYIHRENHYVLN